jgi:hypothetical protein
VHSLVFAALVLSFPTLAHAQDREVEAALAETRTVAERVAREASCLAGKEADLRRIVQQMEDATRQIESPASSADARRDGRLALTALSQRAIRVERAILECRTELSAHARRPGPPEGVTTGHAPLHPNDEAVALENDATRVVERDAVLQPNVGVVVGEQVDGTGTLQPEEVRAAVRDAASLFSRCYDQLVDRGALTRGNIIVTFRVTGSGQTTQARAGHGNLTDSRFVSCMSAAARRIRVSSAPHGGDAVYSYTLRFPGS